MSLVFILDDNHNLVPVDSYHEFARWLDVERERLGQELPVGTLQVRYEQVNGHTLSTVFLGLDHSWGDGPAQLFETMYFDGDDRQWRWSTWDEAVAGHEMVAKMVAQTPGDRSDEGVS